MTPQLAHSLFSALHSSFPNNSLTLSTTSSSTKLGIVRLCAYSEAEFEAVFGFLWPGISSVALSVWRFLMRFSPKEQIHGENTGIMEMGIWGV